MKFGAITSLKKPLFLAVSLVLLGALAGIIYFTYQGSLLLLHPGRSVRQPGDDPSHYGIPYQEITLTTSDGLKLAAWYTPPRNGVVILAAHGYGDKRSAKMHALFARHCFGVLSWDFRAHGESEGRLSTLGYMESYDVETALEYAISQPAVEHVAAWGVSMGAVSNILAAARQPEIEAVLADSAYSTLPDELRIKIPYSLIRPLVRLFAEVESDTSMDNVHPVDVIGKLSPRPVMIIQGLADESIPLDSGQRLYNAAGEPRLLWQEPGVTHVAMFDAFPSLYEQKVIQFLAEAFHF